MTDLRAERPAAGFDCEPELETLLAGLDGARLAEALQRLAGGPVALVDADGRVLLGETVEGAACEPLRVELEPVGTLCAPPAAPGPALAALVEMVLRGAHRLRMASTLHLEAVDDDYRRLQESEQRYRELSQQLERRVAEQVATIETAQRQLYQAEKMASVGQLAAGIAHEINNPLGFIRSNLSTACAYLDDLRAGLPDSAENGPATDGTGPNLEFILSDFEAILAESLEGIDRVARIVRDLKDFSNVDRSEEEVIDLNQLIRSVCNVAASQVGTRALRLELEELPPLRCQPGHLGQVFMNLVLNAVAAVDGGGTISISSRCRNGIIEVVVADDGPGMPPEVQARAFDPFFTTREVGAGTGLGLTVARDIVLAHGGEIALASQPGEGTRVTVCLPLRRDPSVEVGA